MKGKKTDPGIIRQEGPPRSGAALGGMGTGGVELWPDGRFHHWNICNNRPWATHVTANPKRGGPRHSMPPIQTVPGDTDFFLRIHEKGRRPLYRWLFTGCGDMVSTRSHFFRHHKYFFIKSFPAIEYRAEYPFVYLRYVDEEFPVELSLRAWSPFISYDVKNSSLPGFFLDFTLVNKGKKPAEASLVWQQRNFGGYAAARQKQAHEKKRLAKASLVRMRGSLAEPEHDTSGCLSMWALPNGRQEVTSVAANPYMQNLIWPVHKTGDLKGPIYPPRLRHEELADNPAPDCPNKGWLCVKEKVGAGKTAEFNLGLAWFYPHHRSIRGTYAGHMYANWFGDSAAAAAYMIKNRKKLLEESKLLPDMMMRSTMPESLKLSLLDQLNTLTKSTHFIKNGRFGLQEGHGCCAFNTMDVDHYSSYTLSTFFPRLRETVLDMQTSLAHPKLGKIHHGLPGTVEEILVDENTVEGYNRWDCCCQYVLQVYRDCKWSGNAALLKRCWPAAKRAMELIIGMDFYEVGLPYIEGGITYDHWRMKGVVTYMAGLYLAALRAMEDMALFLNEKETARRMNELFKRGRTSFEKLLWNGKQYLLYYRRQPKKTEKGQDERGEEGHLDPQKPSCECADPEACIEVKDTGVMTDALNGNGTAAIMGLGAFLDPIRARKQFWLVLEKNVQPENQSLVNGTYADERFPDEWPFMQWQTPWSGTEHFFAAQLYTVGMADEGDRIMDMVFNRHMREGMRFDHAECNNHYARPLSVWAAYPARLRLDADMLRGELTVKPIARGKKYEGLFMTAAAAGWMKFEANLKRTCFELELRRGEMALKKLTLGASLTPRKIKAALAGQPCPAVIGGCRGAAAAVFTKKLKIKAGNTLKIVIS